MTHVQLLDALVGQRAVGPPGIDESAEAFNAYVEKLRKDQGLIQ